MTQRNGFRRAHGDIEAALDNRRPIRLYRDWNWLNVFIDNHPVARLWNRRVWVLAPPCRAKNVAFIHGAAIKEIAGDAAIGVQPALNFARRKRAWNGGGREQNVAQEFCIAGRDRFARGGYCIEGASGAAVDVGGLISSTRCPSALPACAICSANSRSTCALRSRTRPGTSAKLAFSGRKKNMPRCSTQSGFGLRNRRSIVS